MAPGLIERQRAQHLDVERLGQEDLALALLMDGLCLCRGQQSAK